MIRNLNIKSCNAPPRVKMPDTTLNSNIPINNMIRAVHNTASLEIIARTDHCQIIKTKGSPVEIETKVMTPVIIRGIVTITDMIIRVNRTIKINSKKSPTSIKGIVMVTDKIIRVNRTIKVNNKKSPTSIKGIVMITDKIVGVVHIIKINSREIIEMNEIDTRVHRAMHQTHHHRVNLDRVK